MALSETGEILARLHAAGMTYPAMGAAMGRDKSLMSQVARGLKPGDNLRAAAAELEARLAGGIAARAPEAAAPVRVAPVRRTTAGGVLARVRRPTTVHGRSWSSSTVKRQASRNGARGLGHALADAGAGGRQVAVTVSVDHGIAVESYGSSRRGQAGPGGSVDMRLGDAGEVWSTVRDEYGGNVAAYIADVMVERGHTSADAGTVAEHIAAVELRSFD